MDTELLSEQVITPATIISEPKLTEATSSESSTASKAKTLESSKVLNRNWLFGETLEIYAEKQLILSHSTCFFSVIHHHIIQAVQANNQTSHKTCFDFFSTHLTPSKLFHFVIANSDLSLQFGPQSGCHWILGVISMPHKHILIFDSLIHREVAYYKHFFLKFFRMVEMLCLMSEKAPLIEDWKFIVAADAAQQVNGYDCGSFVCMNVAGFLQNNIDLVKEIPNVRDHIREVVDKKLGPLKTINQTQRFNFQSKYTLNDIFYTLELSRPLIEDYHGYLNNLTCNVCDHSLRGEIFHCMDCKSVIHKGCGSYEQDCCNCYRIV